MDRGSAAKIGAQWTTRRCALGPVDSDVRCNPVDSIGSLSRKSGFPLRTPAFSSVSKGQRRLGEKEYRSPFSDAGGCTSPQNSGPSLQHLWPEGLIDNVTEGPKPRCRRRMGTSDVRPWFSLTSRGPAPCPNQTTTFPSPNRRPLGRQLCLPISPTSHKTRVPNCSRLLALLRPPIRLRA